MSIKKHIPNAITCCNLLCGCLAIVQAFEGNLVYSAYLVGLAAIFDFFDGFAARLLRVASPIGKDLDSLADMVTFGVVPGIILFQIVRGALYLDKEGFAIFENLRFFIYIPFLITIFSAIRLAKFNNDNRQTDSFIGVPTPAVAIIVCSLPLITNWNSQFSFVEYHRFESFLNPYYLCVLSIVLSFLLVAELPLFALKFRNFSWRGNRIRYTFLGLSLILLITLQFIGIPLVILLYILIRVITNFYLKRRVS
jgi:CDP-diacylglycerol--serine O-phosphatidyltransferase